MQTLQQKLLSYKAPSIAFAVSLLCLRLFTYYAAHAPNVRVVYNFGVAFGLGYAGGMYPVGVAMGLFCCWVIIFCIAKKYLLIPISLILAGSLSNIIDRFQGRGVIDYLYIGNWVGNPADIVICIGIVWILWSIIKGNARSY